MGNNIEKRAETNSLAVLLKAPETFAQGVHGDAHSWRQTIILFLAGLAFHVVYGVAMGAFGGWKTGVMTAAKAPAIALCSLALCLPSLYVFSCVAGMTISLRQACVLAAAGLAMTGLILVGLAPVTWLFSVSTESVAFISVLNLLVWLLALGFTIRVFTKVVTLAGGRGAAGLRFWLVVYMVVSMQMATTMRPLLARPETGYFAGGKKFFVSHFFETLDPQKKPALR